jgi:hypothetical protein
VAAVDGERRVRILAEDEATATMQGAEANRARESLVQREEAQALQLAADQNRKWFENQQANRQEMLASEQVHNLVIYSDGEALIGRTMRYPVVYSD